MNIVDRRPNPKGKSLSNRQRFLGRARAEVKSAVQEALRKRKVADVGQGEKVAIPTRGITEPVFIIAGAPAAPSTSSLATKSISEATKFRGRRAAKGEADRRAARTDLARMR